MQHVRPSPALAPATVGRHAATGLIDQVLAPGTSLASTN